MAELVYVRARYAGNFVVAMQQLGIPVAPALEKVRLSEEILEKPDSWIAAHQLWEMARLAALRSGKLDLGYDAGTVAGTAAHGEFGQMVVSQPTLYQRLQAFCDGARAEYSKADFRVEWANGTVYFSRWPIDGDEVQRRQIELYVLPMMLDTIRSALGEDWQPQSLSLQSFEGADVAARVGRRTPDLRWERPVTRIEIGDTGFVQAICRALDQQDRQSEHAEAAGESPPLSQIIETHLEDPDFSLDALAEMFGMNRRTFQFRLARSGTSFSDFVAEARMRLSARLLADPAVPIVDIALRLGYSCQSHYTRAFRNWSGTTPLKFRRHALTHASENAGLPTAVPQPAE